MKTFLTLFFLCHAVLAEKHSLKYFLTGTSGTTNFPEFVGLIMMDGVQIGYCDSIIKRVEAKQNWLRLLLTLRPQFHETCSQRCLQNQQLFKANVNVVKQRLNQTEDFHILQSMTGCEWDSESNETKGFDQYGYDGEDFIALDLQTMAWITPKAQALVIKQLWDKDKARIERNKNYYLTLCPDYLKYLMYYGSSFWSTTDSPSVFLLQKTPSSLVSCHATGFYPHKADLFWRKDGEEIHEDVEKGQILPNNDGTFQMSSELNVSLVKHEDWRRYDCVFQLSGVKEDIITTLDKTEIQTNWVSPSEIKFRSVVRGAVGVVLLLVLGVFGLFWKKRNDFKPVDDDQEKEEFSSE